MGKWSIEVACLLADALLCLYVLCVANLPHQVHPVGNHYQDYPHVFGERQKQVAEVLAFDYRVLLVEVLDMDEALQNLGDRLPELLQRFVESGLVALCHTCIQQHSDCSVTLQPYLVNCD